MIPFFRKIRKKMADDNRPRKYMRYAVGEIALVVIGILIALQINTWNENRKASNEELKILKALESDFKVSKKRLEKTLEIQSKVMDCSQVLLNIHESKNQSQYQYFDTHLDSLDELISFGTSWYRAEPITGAYNSLTNSGKIDLIKNEELRHLLAQFIADFESGFEDQESAMLLLDKLNDGTNHFIFKIAKNKYRKRLNYNLRKIDSIKIAESFFTNDSYFGNLYLKSLLEYNRLIRQKQLLEQSTSILEIINDELENKQ